MFVITCVVDIVVLVNSGVLGSSSVVVVGAGVDVDAVDSDVVGCVVIEACLLVTVLLVSTIACVVVNGTVVAVFISSVIDSSKILEV